MNPREKQFPISSKRMRTKKTTARQDVAKAESSQPEVIVDFVFNCGLFHIVVANVSATPAYRVSVTFDRKFHGLGGRQEISGLRLFRCIEFLAPHRSIETFLDGSDAYFQRREPTRLAATVAFRDAQRRLFERRIVHDLSIYKNVSYLLKPAGTNPTVVPEPAPAAATPTIGGIKYVRIERPTLH